MGFVEKMTQRGTRLIQSRLKKEYGKAGSTARAEPETAPCQSAVWSGILSELAVGFLGGRIAPESVWVLRLENQGLLHWYFQPLTKSTLLPGEHHTILPGSVAGTTGLERDVGFFNKAKWWSDDGEFAQVLNADGELRKTCKRVTWTWELALGGRITFDAPLQLRSLGNGHAHVALKTGNYGGGKVGFQFFVDVCRGLGRHLKAGADYPKTGFRTEYGYSQIALSEWSTGPG